MARYKLDAHPADIRRIGQASGGSAPTGGYGASLEFFQKAREVRLKQITAGVLLVEIKRKKSTAPARGAVLTANSLLVAKILTYPPFRN